MTREELLLKLRDIDAPPEPPWWLLAPAWLWLAIAIAGALGAAWWWARRRRSQRFARLARAELHAIESAYRHDGDARQLAYRVSGWLRQVAILAYPGQPLERTSGAAWLRFLDADLDGKPFSEGCGRVFGEQLYRRKLDIEADQVIALCQRWLRSVEPRLRRRGRAA